MTTMSSVDGVSLTDTLNDSTENNVRMKVSGECSFLILDKHLYIKTVSSFVCAATYLLS